MSDIVETLIEQPAAPAAEPAVETPAAPPSQDDVLGQVFDRMTRDSGANRGPDGRFVSPNAGTGEPPVVAENGAGSDGVGAVPPLASVIAPAPAHLPQSIKTDWEKLPETTRNEIARLTGEWDRKFGEQGKQLGQVKPIADRLTAAVQKFPEFHGMTPDQIADGALQLAAVQSSLNKDPVKTLIDVAQSYGVLAHLSAALQGQEAPAGADSTRTIAALERKIAGMEAELKKVANPETVRAEISRTMQEQDAETQVKTFAKDKEFWADVEAHLPPFIQKALEMGPGKPIGETLSLAYDMAINALPEVRAKVRAAEAKATAAKPDPKLAEAARKAVSINVKSSANGKDRAMSDDEVFGSAYDRAMAN